MLILSVLVNFSSFLFANCQFNEHNARAINSSFVKRTFVHQFNLNELPVPETIPTLSNSPKSKTKQNELKGCKRICRKFATEEERINARRIRSNAWEKKLAQAALERAKETLSKEEYEQLAKSARRRLDKQNEAKKKRIALRRERVSKGIQTKRDEKQIEKERLKSRKNYKSKRITKLKQINSQNNINSIQTDLHFANNVALSQIPISFKPNSNKIL